jgi:ATP-dependent RNA helicase DDX20
LAPTREIAVQTKEVICNIGRYMKGLSCHVFIGGLPISEDLPKLKKCQIVIGSPGISLNFFFFLSFLFLIKQIIK